MQYNIYNRIRISLQKYYLFQTLQSFFADLFYLDGIYSFYLCQNESVKVFRYFLFGILSGILSQIIYNFVFFRGFQ